VVRELHQLPNLLDARFFDGDARRALAELLKMVLQLPRLLAAFKELVGFTAASSHTRHAIHEHASAG